MGVERAAEQKIQAQDAVKEARTGIVELGKKVEETIVAYFSAKKPETRKFSHDKGTDNGIFIERAYDDDSIHGDTITIYLTENGFFSITGTFYYGGKQLKRRKITNPLDLINLGSKAISRIGKAQPSQEQQTS